MLGMDELRNLAVFLHAREKVLINYAVNNDEGYAET